MKPDSIEIGKTYQMLGRLLDRHVVDIIWHPAGGSYAREYREIVLEIRGGKRPGRIERGPLAWFAANAHRAIE
jgi:hypothetical protein